MQSSCNLNHDIRQNGFVKSIQASMSLLPIIQKLVENFEKTFQRLGLILKYQFSNQMLDAS